MKRLSFIVRAVRNPVEGVIGIFSTGLFLYALYLLSPWHATNAGVILASFFILSSIPGLLAPFIKRRETGLKLASFGLFLSFLFLTILRIVLLGWVPLTWLPLLMISLSSAYLHIWLKVRQE